MEIKSTPIEGVYEIHPTLHADKRGFLMEVFRDDLLRDWGVEENWVQENQLFTHKGTLRGLHFQKHPHGQAKLARVVVGKVLDVCVDLRKNSPTFGMHHAVVLDALQHNMLFVPSGFAHGILALEDTIFCYKCSHVYRKHSQGGLLWNDPRLKIDWKIENPMLSEKDVALPGLDVFVKDSGGGL